MRGRRSIEVISQNSRVNMRAALLFIFLVSVVGVIAAQDAPVSPSKLLNRLMNYIRS